MCQGPCTAHPLAQVFSVSKWELGKEHPFEGVLRTAAPETREGYLGSNYIKIIRAFKDYTGVVAVGPLTALSPASMECPVDKGPSWKGNSSCYITPHTHICSEEPSIYTRESPT